MDTGTLTSRRRFLYLAGGLAAGFALPAVSAADKGEEAGFSPVQGLMREHGILRRVILIYEEASFRVAGGKEVPHEIITDSAGIVRRFIHDYHEKFEEEEIFPRLQKAGRQDDLVRVLSAQHQAGRRLTDSILKLLEPQPPKPSQAKQEKPPEETSAAVQEIYNSRPLFKKIGPDPVHPNPKYADTKQLLYAHMQQFVRMYRPHLAREDTVIFTAFGSTASAAEIEELGKKFDEKERGLFGRDGFANIVESVADVERKLGIHDLSQFTATA